MWKKIIDKGIITDYSVNEFGEIKKDTNDYIMKQQIQNGYKHVTLQINKKPKRFNSHRLVAIAFIPNPENKPYVNHKDGNRTNNCVDNLEWVTAAENTQHAVKTGLMPPTKEKAVVQFDLNGNKIREFKSLSEAERLTGSMNSKICLCCQLKRKQHNGFQWRYKNECGEKLNPIEEYRTKKKSVAQIDIETGEIIAIYDSLNAAARAVGGSHSAISNIINKKKQTKTHKGYGWKIVEDIVQ